jgi:hypothetical protein
MNQGPNINTHQDVPVQIPSPHRWARARSSQVQRP